MAVKIEKDTIIGDVLDLAPETAPLFQAIGMHLNAVLYQITHSLPQTNDLKQTLARLKNTCHLTNRELQIAEQIYQYRNNDEIAGSLGIRENTLQKHLQNIFRKTNVTSRWELMRFRMR